ncbi:MAG TPA: hypothetical protein VND91_04195, partial [Candidatus Saccharimonadia bacterium]|nr:hypothetical protein [Candidatus Saccharimonadia bacterium]
RTQSPAAQALERLGELVGDWEGTLADGRTHRVNYRWSAGNAVLVETWTLGPDRESLTIYHRDGEALLATHYCPQFTHPRLRLVEQEGDRLSFAFVDGANLDDPERHHQHSFWIRFVDADTFERSETYVANGASAGEIASAKAEPATVFKRMAK